MKFYWKLKNPDTVDKWSTGHFFGNFFSGFLLLILCYFLNRHFLQLPFVLVVYWTSILNFNLWFCWEILEYNLQQWKYQYKFPDFFVKFINKVADSNGISLFDVCFNLCGNIVFFIVMLILISIFY